MSSIYFFLITIGLKCCTPNPGAEEIFVSNFHSLFLSVDQFPLQQKLPASFDGFNESDTGCHLAKKTNKFESYFEKEAKAELDFSVKCNQLKNVTKYLQNS